MPKESGKHHNWSFAPNRKSITFLASSLVVAKLHTTQSPGRILDKTAAAGTSRSSALVDFRDSGFGQPPIAMAGIRLNGVLTGVGLFQGGRWMTGGRPPRQHLASSVKAGQASCALGWIQTTNHQLTHTASSKILHRLGCLPCIVIV